MQKFLVFLLIILSFNAQSQLIDNFQDGDFTNNPEWKGDGEMFKINASHQLQLNATIAGDAYLSTGIEMKPEMEWQFWIRMSFAPSDNNFSRIYLVSNNENVKQSLDGYYLQFGENGANDAIELVRQHGDIHTVICRGADASIAATFAARVKVLCNSLGEWKIFIDKEGGNNFILDATGNDNAYLNGNFFGVFCKYTSSNMTKFYFDDIYAGEVKQDTIAPKVVNLLTSGPNQLTLIFDENIDKNSAENINNFILLPENTKPTNASLSSNQQEIILNFQNDFSFNTEYKLQVSNIKDIAGNTMLPIEKPFAIYEHSAFDILINEIMADPTPIVGLPDAEYIELYNRSDFSIDLENWTLKIGNTMKLLPKYIIPAKQFVLLCDDGVKPLLQEFGDIIDFTSFSLANTGAELTLANSVGQVIHHVKYTDKWYKDNYKKDGGWSLELIDPNNPCDGEGNWSASIDNKGGTPGKQNSVFGSNPDNSQPFIKQIGLISENEILVTLSESCDSTTLKNISNFEIHNVENITNPAESRGIAPGYNEVYLKLSNTLQQGVLYKLVCKNLIKDCVGNPLNDTIVGYFAIPTQAEANDIIINEVLFSPNTNCVEFIELWNISDKVIDLKELILANYDTIANVNTNFNEISTNSFLMKPDDYIIVSTNSQKVMSCYKTLSQNSFIDVASMPKLNKTNGSIALCLKGGFVIDRMAYTDKMHFALLKTINGVSLERINPYTSSLDKNNWHSAAETAGFGTPGYKNSQYSQQAIADGEIEISPKSFSPDNDGYNDFTTIKCKFQKSSNMINITIYDASGKVVRKLAENELCGSSCEFVWDGINDKRQKTTIGRYLVLIETYDLEGNNHKYKQSVVVSGKF